MRRCLLLFLSFIVSLHSLAQDSILMNELMQRIAIQQIRDNAFFTNGIFPSYISNQPCFSKHKKDNNVFFTALIDYTLNGLHSRHLINSAQYDSIHAQALLAYPFFKKKRIA